MRDALVLAIVLGSLPVTLYRPFFGLAIYAWIAYMRPHELAWNITWPISMFVAVAVLLGLVFAVRRERFLTLGAQSYLLMGLCFWAGLASFMAIRSDLATDRFILLGKVILISLVTTGLVRNRERYRILFTVIAFSLGALGLKYGLYGLVRGGVILDHGPGGFIIDNNSLAMALAMTVPLLAGLALIEKQRWIRVVAAVLLVFSVAAIIFTFSRGGLLSLAVVGLALLVRSGRPLLAILLMALCLTGLVVGSSSAFLGVYSERVSTIAEFDTDASAMGRLEQWGVALRIFRDYPLFGVGPNNLQVVYRTYSPGAERLLVTHNSFLQMLVDSGLPAFLLFLSLIGVSLWRLEHLGHSGSTWISTHARMLQISLGAYVVGGMFLDMAYFDMTYQLVALSLSLEVVAQTGALAEEIPDAELAKEIPWWKQASA